MNKNLNIANKNATQILKSFFNPGLSTGMGSVLINNPVFLSQDFFNEGVLRISVQLSYYIGKTSNINTIAPQLPLKTVVHALTQMYESVLEQPVKVELELTQSYQPYMDASILAQYLAINASCFGFNRMMNGLLMLYLS